MILLSANNASTTLAASIGAGTTTIVLASGFGAKFPSPTANEYFTLTLCDALTQLVFEVCYCTSRTGDNLTVIRGRDNTTAQSWIIGDYAYNTLTASGENTSRSFSSTNTPTLPYTIPPEHFGVTQICALSGTITLPSTAGIYDGFPCVIIAGPSTTVIVNTNSSVVVTPGGSVTGNFTMNGLSIMQLQWSALANAWYAISSTLPHAEITFLASGAWTCPFNIFFVFARVWAGGGGSGGTNGAVSASLGGGGGGYAEGWVAVVPGTTYAVTVGLAGAPGVASSTPTAGSAGGTSSFSSFITALGGNGGPAANGGIIGPVAGGGIGVGGSFQAPGGTSFAAFAVPVGVVTSAGGAAWSGAMAHLGATGSPADGVAGLFPGGGAAGAANGGTGAPGANGVVILGY